MILIISILTLIYSSFLFSRASGTLSFREFNMCSYIFFLMLVWTFFGSIMIAYDFGVIEDRMPFDNEYRIMGWGSIMYAMIGIPLGMILIAKFFKISSMKSFLLAYKQSTWKSSLLGISYKDLKTTLYLVSGLSLIVNIGLILSSWDSLPLINLFFKNTSFVDAYVMRNNFRLISFGNPLLNSLLVTISSMTLFSTYTFFLYYKIDKRFFDLIWFIILFITSIALLTIDLNKGRSLFFLIGFLFLISFLNNKIKWKTFIVISFSGLILIGLTYVFFMGAYSQTINPLELISYAFAAIKTRVLVTQISGLYYCFDIFPERLPFIGFSSTGRFIHEIFNLNFSPDYGLLVRYLTVKGAGISGSGQYTTMFLGEAWSNFGFIGLIFSPLLVGIVIQLINLFILQSPKTPIAIAIYTQLAINFPILSGFRSFYYPVWLLEYSLLFALIIIIGKAVSNKSKIISMED